MTSVTKPTKSGAPEGGVQSINDGGADPLRTQAERLHTARQDWEAKAGSLAERREAFEAQNQALIELVSEASSRVDAEAQALRALILARYQQTDEKQVGFGCGIRLVKKVEADPAAAFAFAREKGLALRLDQSAFEKIVLASLSPATPQQREDGSRVYQTSVPSAVVVETPQATIATDLGAALAKGGAA